MNPLDHHSEAAWERILPHVRATRRRRRRHRIVAATASCALLGTWLVLQSSNPPDPPVALAEPVPPVHQTIAVMRIGGDGSVRLEEVSCHELGSLELAFGLAPVIAHDWEIR